jgi:heme/copper-type cytochrome/quinol oxidase subunit 1
MSVWTILMLLFPGIPLVGGIYIIALYISQMNKPPKEQNVSTLGLVMGVLLVVLVLGSFGYLRYDHIRDIKWQKAHAAELDYA